MKVAETNMFLPYSKDFDGATLMRSLSVPFMTASTNMRVSTEVLREPGWLYRNRGILGFRLEDETDSNKDLDSSQVPSSSLRASSQSFSTDSSHASELDQMPWPAEDGEHCLSWTISSWSSEGGKSQCRLDCNQALLETLYPMVSQFAMNSGNTTYGSLAVDDITYTSLSFIPWVPTASQVQNLSIFQLKQALADRRLLISGSKSALQQRLIQWISLQGHNLLGNQQSLQAQLSGIKEHSTHGSHKQGQQPTQCKGESCSHHSFGDKSTISWYEENELSLSGFQPEDDKTWSTKRDKKVHKEDDDNLTTNSLVEWSSTYDLLPLLQRRKAIHRELELGKGMMKDNAAATSRDEESSLMSKEEYISVLKKVFDRSAQSRYSNYEVKQMYAAAKEADQIGDRALSKRILTELKEVTPRDARLYRRLARMEKEEGNIVGARHILQEGLQMDPQNPYLWLGLGQIASSDPDAMEHYRKSIQCDPTLPMPYHALGSLQHTKGQIAAAMKTFKEGLQYCPSNHRLHHALGDIYRDAKILEMADKCYRKALKHGPTISHGFAYNALAYVAYEDADVNGCRSWLQKAVALNDGRNANGWVSLAQMEEAEGNIDTARRICIDGIAKYERNLLKRVSVKFRKTSVDASSSIASAIRNRLMTRVPVYRSGDRFFNLYRNWARLEERWGNADSVSEVYRRAFLAFPTQWKLTIDWAHYHSRLNIYERAIDLFSIACSQAAGQHGDPYRCYAEYEMSRGNYPRAQEILRRGAAAFARATGDVGRDRNGMVELYYVWAVCEWHLANFARTETLFDFALKSLGEERPDMKCLILFAKAKLYHFRDEPYLAQNCIGLCLKENRMPVGTKWKVFYLWAEVAQDMNNEKLCSQCRILAEKSHTNEAGREGDSLHHVVSSTTKGLQGVSGVQNLLRRDPWHYKIFGVSSRQRATSYESVRLPMSFEDHECL